MPEKEPEPDRQVVPVNIAEDVSHRLQAAGRPAEEADAAGQVSEALWRTRSAAFEGRKGTAEEMYAREAPTIRAGSERAREPELAQREKDFEQRRLPPLSDKVAMERAGQGAMFERSAKQAQAARDADGNLKANVPQKPMDEGLFSSERDQRELFQRAQGSIRLTEDGRTVITLMRAPTPALSCTRPGTTGWTHDARRRRPGRVARMRDDASTVRRYLGSEEGAEISGRSTRNSPAVSSATSWRAGRRRRRWLVCSRSSRPG